MAINKGSHLLVESGLGGHILHLYEDENLTFADLKNILKLASIGKLEDVTEKVDGQNLFITWDVKKGQLKTARNKSDIKSGGMDAQQIAQKFSTYTNNVSNAFINGYNVIAKSLAALDSKTLAEIFGATANIWFSVEILYKNNANAIFYDRNAIVFHKSGIGYDKNGAQLPTEIFDKKLDDLMSHLSEMQAQIGTADWQLLPPVTVQLKNMVDKTPLVNAVEGIKQLQAEYGLSDSDTVGKFLAVRLEKDVLSQLSVSANIQAKLADKLLGKSGIDLKQIKSIVPAQLYPKIDVLIKNEKKIKHEALKPLETIIHAFGAELLKNIKAELTLHPEKAIEKIRSEIDKIKKQASTSGNKEDIAFVNKQLERLRSGGGIISSMEGIVFKYNGKVYKLTGNFQPINQILGLYKYKLS